MTVLFMIAKAILEAITEQGRTVLKRSSETVKGYIACAYD